MRAFSVSFNTNLCNLLSCKYLIMLTKEMMEKFISKLQHKRLLCCTEIIQ
eukprot:GAHX01007220.1.p1 GENE.GAHX01007220.1~~GAHX01007220.1.p1  ORF type:complete len:50 (+),score=1.05 GAHX01007220.1:91-240(+)